ncbi:MAG TPA: GTPase HflX [Acholeplasmataceae bacterium]|nr:GTPase HflX [Acholeplasmataceae bacterium]
MDNALLVFLDLGLYDLAESKKELENLAIAAELNVLDSMTQKLDKPTSNYYIGSGKVAELKKTVEVLKIDVCVFDTELSPAQIRNLEEALDTQVIDRGFLILQIFAKRAKTKEARLEIDLAQQKYLLPRLIGLSSSLSRQGGGSFNSKGPGEKKLELDRRRIESNITKLEDQLKKVHLEKKINQKRRQSNQIPIVALVGYTNAGKSSTMNSLLMKLMRNEEKKVFEKNMLFATLQTQARQINYYNEPSFILTDTVGFVSRLPHDLVNSFKSTLEEVKQADLILHIIDGSNPNYQHQMTTTNDVLDSIEASHIETINVLTKLDLMINQNPITDFNYLSISNKTKTNLDLLIDEIYTRLFGQKIEVDLSFTYEEKSLISALYQSSKIIDISYLEDEIRVKSIIRESQLVTYQNQLLSKELPSNEK